MIENKLCSALLLNEDLYYFLINGEVLSVRKDFMDGDVFNTITLTTEQLNSFEWLDADPAVTITVNGTALEDGRCEFSLAEISQDEKIQVRVSGTNGDREFLINTLNTNLPPVTAEGTSLTAGDFFLSFINTRSIVKTDNNGKSSTTGTKMRMTPSMGCGISRPTSWTGKLITATIRPGAIPATRSCSRATIRANVC